MLIVTEKKNMIILHPIHALSPPNDMALESCQSHIYMLRYPKQNKNKEIMVFVRGLVLTNLVWLACVLLFILDFISIVLIFPINK